jgi:polyhydroxybutyrate depolymerase
MRLLAFAPLALAFACGSPVVGSDPPSGLASDMARAAAQPDLGPANALVAARPYLYDTPSRVDPRTPAPLVILLHGYGVNGVTQKIYFGLGDLLDAQGAYLAYPDGTVDKMGKRFWNATDACCDFYGNGVDDVAYIDAIIDDMSAHFAIDPKRVFITGHSNGGYMAHRYACDRAARVAAIVALAGDDWLDASKCKPSEPVAVLQIHGTADSEVPYNGGQLDPSARASVAGWAQKNGCVASPTDTSQPPLDLDSNLAGAETTRERWSGCKPGGAAELWTITGGDHIPSFVHPNWENQVWGWFAAHPKP